MLNNKRLTQIEMSLTPDKAVLLWLRQEHQGKTTQELRAGFSSGRWLRFRGIESRDKLWVRFRRP
jgi:hypothetical protein